MEESDLIERLRALSASVLSRKNQTARLRVHITPIEVALGKGVSLQQVLDEFNRGQGDSAMKLSSFKSALKRVRAEQRGGTGMPKVLPEGSRAAVKIAGEAPAKRSMAEHFLPGPKKQ